ncbi:DUF4143 domain-containing protein [Rhizobium grahamii]|uniref:DUF4143 domain-containing protein n=1 Tax=Rhizobium grahamii TaxID=1120045 RepID=UPI003F6DB804
MAGRLCEFDPRPRRGDIANIDQLDRLPRLLDVLAEHAGQLVNQSSFGVALGLSSITAQKYVAILERLFLIRTLVPWSNNRLSRLVKTPKLHLKVCCQVYICPYL